MRASQKIPWGGGVQGITVFARGIRHLFSVILLWTFNKFEFRSVNVYDLDTNRHAHEKSIGLNCHLSLN